jgi:hypothetical protein
MAGQDLAGPLARPLSPPAPARHFFPNGLFHPVLSPGNSKRMTRKYTVSNS